MKTKQLLLSSAILIIALSLSITGCRKDKPKDPADTDTSGAEDNSLADKSFEDMGQISNEAASPGGVKNYKLAGYDGLLSHCIDTIIRDTVNRRITVDFGPTNCLCHDNRYRRGKIFISYTLGYHGFGYWDSLSNITVTTTDPITQVNTYFVNDNQIIGTKSITNKGRNSAGHLNWDLNVNGKIIKANNQGTITWTSSRNREWIAGYITPFQWGDDIYGVTGTASGTSANGTQFSMTITSQLLRKMSCPQHFVSGTFDFTPGTKPVRHVDFGYSLSPAPSGSCDSWISITINSNTYYKQLP